MLMDDSFFGSGSNPTIRKASIKSLRNGAGWQCTKYSKPLGTSTWPEYRGKLFRSSHRVHTDFIYYNRKLLLCAIATQDFGNARDIFGSMSDMAKNEPMTRFLMYKVAIRCNELTFASECLQVVGSPSTKDATLLYACVLDAQQVGNRLQAVAALQLVLDKHSDVPVGMVHLPSLLRVTIKLTSSLLDDTKPSEDASSLGIVERLCKLFEDSKLLISTYNPN
jgi:hypothetical protein